MIAVCMMPCRIASRGSARSRAGSANARRFPSVGFRSALPLGRTWTLRRDHRHRSRPGLDFQAKRARPPYRSDGASLVTIQHPGRAADGGTEVRRLRCSSSRTAPPASGVRVRRRVLRMWPRRRPKVVDGGFRGVKDAVASRVAGIRWVQRMGTETTLRQLGKRRISAIPGIPNPLS